jgi:hypothetical protein
MGQISLCLKSVSRAPNRLYVRRVLRVFFDFLPQSADMHGYGFCIAVYVA